MRVSNKQKRALEKVTGKHWDTWHHGAVRAYFSFTDRGIRTALFDRVWKLQLRDNELNEIEKDLWDLIQHHAFHPYTIECWKEDFRVGLLFLDDFLNVDYPEAYIRHAFEIYRGEMGYIPSKYRQVETTVGATK